MMAATSCDHSRPFFRYNEKFDFLSLLRAYLENWSRVVATGRGTLGCATQADLASLARGAPTGREAEARLCARCARLLVAWRALGSVKSGGWPPLGH